MTSSVAVKAQVAQAVDEVVEMNLHDRLMTAGVQPLDPEYVRREKRQVLWQTWPRVIGPIWQIPWCLSIIGIIAGYSPIVVGPILLYQLGHGFLACAGLILAGLIAGVLLTMVLMCWPVEFLTAWLGTLCARSSTRWARTDAARYQPHRPTLPPGPQAIWDQTFLGVYGCRFVVEYPASTHEVPDPFLIAVLDHEDGVPEECYIARWE